MINNAFRVQKIRLDLARKLEKARWEAAGFAVVASSPGARLSLAIGDTEQAPVDLAQGLAILDIPLADVYLTNTAQPGGYVDVALFSEPSAANASLAQFVAGNRPPTADLSAAVAGELHSTDASGGVQASIYSAGTLTPRAIGASERLAIVAASVVSAAAGDVRIFSGGDMTPDAGETILRGTVAAGGGLAMHWPPTAPRVLPLGATPRVIAPAGVVDFVFTGFVF